MVESIEYLTTEDTVNMFERFDVFSRAELESRAEIKYETYAKVINIESRSMIDIASKHIIPAVIKYITALASSINQVRQASGDVTVEVQEELLAKASELLTETRNALKKLEEVTAQVENVQPIRDKAFFFREHIVPAMEALRKPVDELEMIVDKNMWPMPSYGDLLFEV